MSKYFALKDSNHESHGYDHRLGEWQGAEMVSEGKFRAVKLSGRQALLALLEAKGNPVLEFKGKIVSETLGTGAIAMGPMKCAMSGPPKKKKPPMKEDEKAPTNPITGEVTDKTKEVIADEEMPGETDKTTEPKKKEWVKPWLKDKGETTEEARKSDGSMKSSALHGPQVAGRKAPIFKEAIARGIQMREFSPEDISSLITEDPDVLSDETVLL